jgi:CHAT domain-containing protein
MGRIISYCLFLVMAIQGSMSAGIAQVVSPAPRGDDERELRELTIQYYYAYEEYSFDKQAAMWSHDSKDPASKRKRDKAQEQATITPPKIEKLDIWRVIVNGDRAIVFAKVLMTTFRRDNGKPVGGWFNRDVSFRHTFVREAVGWKLLEIEFRAIDLAADLMKTDTDAERDVLRTNFPDLSILDQVLAIEQAANDLERKEPNPPRTLSLLLYGYRLAEQTNDIDTIGIFVSQLSGAYVSVGDHGQALMWHLKGLELEEKRGEMGNVPNALNSVGVSYATLGDSATAIEYYKKSIAASATVKLPPTLQRELRVSGNLANGYLDQGDTVKARQIYERLLALAENDKDKTAVVGPLQGLGAVYKAEGRYIEAIEVLSKALKANEGSRVRGRDQGLLRSLAEVSLLNGDYEQASKYAGQAIEIAISRGLKAQVWEAYMTDSRAAIATFQYSKARASLEEAIRIVEAMRDKAIGNEEAQQQFFRDKVAVYQTMVELLMREQNESSAFEYAERAKARVLLDLIAKGRRGIQKSMTAGERQEEMKLLAASQSADSAIERAKNDPATPAAKLEELVKAAAAARVAHSTFRSRLYIEHPELRVNRGDINPVTLSEAANLLPDPRSATLELVVSEDIPYLFVLTHNAAGKASLNAIKIGVTSKDLFKETEVLRSKLAAGDLDFQKASRELYDLLLKPVEKELAGKTNIIIVPDGPLWDLPFQALQDEKGKFLVEKAAISYAPSLTALREMSKKAKTRKSDAGMELLAFGNPIVGAPTKERVQRVFMSEKLEPIPEAERLVNSLAKMYGPKRSKLFVGADAREEIAKTESPKYRIVQFATHGILNNASPMYSHLVLAQNDKNPNEDGLLEAWELKDLDLKADMVILSACETARGKISNGEGVIGMTWASFIAGAPTTVASQWKVESSSTTELMLEFHRQLLAKPRVSKAEALRRASLKLMKMPKYRHPSYWAGFVLVGDGS